MSWSEWKRPAAPAGVSGVDRVVTKDYFKFLVVASNTLKVTGLV